MPKQLRHISKKYRAAQQKHVRRIKRIVKKPLFTIPFATLMIFLVAIMAVFLVLSHGTPKLRIDNSTIVILSYDKKQQTVATKAKTVGDLLNRLQVTLNPGDVVEPSQATQIIGDNFRINVYRAVPVTVIDGDQRTYSYSAATTPRSILRQIGIQVYPEDNLELLPTENFLTDGSLGERVVIDRATPINLNLYGTPVVLRTHSKTVGALLAEKKIQLHPGDTVQPAEATPLAANTQVFVIRKGSQIVTVTQDIEMPTQTIEDDSLTFGTTAIRQAGSVGKKVITYQLQLENGVEVSRQEIQEVVTVQPVAQIVAKGKAVQIPSDKQAVMALAGISSGDYAYVDYIVSHESGWCPTKLQGQYGDCPAYPPSSMPAYLGYGLGQATPGTKMAPFGSDWEVSAVTQLRWATSYADGRYGSWGAAYNYWYSHHNW